MRNAEIKRSSDVINVGDNLLIRQKFDVLYKKAIIEAEAEIEILKRELNIEGLTLDDKILKVYKRDKEIEILYNDFEKPEYSENGNSPEWLFNFFYNRLVILGVDESELLRMAIVLNKKHFYLSELYLELAQKTETYSYKEFLDGKKNVFLCELNIKPYHISDEDFYMIRNWQSKHFVKIIELEYQTMRCCFLEEYAKNSKVFFKERQRFQSLYDDYEKISSEEILSRLNKFVPLKRYDFSILDADNLLKEFRAFANEEQLRSDISPSNVYPILTKYKTANFKYPITGLPFILFALNRYDLWLEEVDKQNLSISESLLSDFTFLFEETKNKANDLAETEIETFINTVDVKDLSKKDYSKFLFEEFEELRVKLNKLEHLHYFNFLGKNDVLFNMFSYNCYFGGDISRQQKQLFDSVFLDEKISFFRANFLKSMVT